MAVKAVKAVKAAGADRAARAVQSARDASPAVARSRHRGKRMKALAAVKPQGPLSLDEAIAFLRESAHEKGAVKFDQGFDIAVRLGVDPRHADQMVRGVCQLPHGTGRVVRVAVFAKGDAAAEAEKAGADLVGAEELVETVQKGKIEFDSCVATPDMMPLVGRLGKILGPRGLMPNPKTGAVTKDVGRAVQQIKAGAVQFRVERAGIVHAGIGRLSFSVERLRDNAVAFIDAVRRAKPSGAKGTYLKSIALSATMGVGVGVDPTSLSDSP